MDKTDIMGGVTAELSTKRSGSWLIGMTDSVGEVASSCGSDRLRLLGDVDSSSALASPSWLHNGDDGNT